MEEIKNTMPVLKGVFGVLTIFLIVVIISYGVDIADKLREAENTITVSASGEVYAKPDLALTSFSVVIEAKTVAEAMEENTKKMNNIIQAMKDQGVEEKDLKTTSFYVYPRYEWHETRICIYPPCPSNERVLVGYEITQSLQVKIRDMEKIGDIIQAATDKGANQVGDLQFTIDDQDALKDQAREEAIKKAKTKAKNLASQLGIKLLRISNFSESGAVPYYYRLESQEAAMGMGGGGDIAPDIETGENKITVTVSITYDVK